MKAKNLYYGLFFIAAAAVIILNYAGLLGGISLWSIIIALLILPIFIKSIIHCSFPGILFPLAIFSILFAKQLKIEALTPWPVLGIALFLSIGLSIIFPKKHKLYVNHHKFPNDYKTVFDEPEFSKNTKENLVSAENMDDEKIWVKTRFSGSVKYITSQNLKELNIYNSFGGTEIYLDNANLSNDEAAVNVYASFGGVEIYIPKEWKVINDINCIFGAVEERGLKSTYENNNTLYLNGTAKFSGIEIIRI